MKAFVIIIITALINLINISIYPYFSYEKGEEDYEEAVARLEEEKEVEEGRAASQVSPIVSIFQMFGKSILSKVIEGGRSADDGSPIFSVLEVITKSILSKEASSSRGSQQSDPLLSVVNMVTDVVLGNQNRRSDTNETSLVGSPRGDNGSTRKSLIFNIIIKLNYFLINHIYQPCMSH